MVLVLLALVGTLVCPPVHERTTPPDPAARNELADPEPAPVDFPLPAGERRVPLPTGGGQELRIEVRDRDAGLPLADAEVLLLHEDHHGTLLRSPVPLAPDGTARLESLPSGAYQVLARRRGFFPPPPATVQLPASEPVALLFELEPAALISGELRTVDGSPVASGLVRLSRPDRPQVFHLCPVDPRGDRFESPPLDAGVWTVEFLESPAEQPGPGMVAEVAVVPRQELRLRITVRRPGMEPAADRAPGIEVLD
ncbi:MAG: carboxypeptidase regulatory-like domain-containing protein [Planctomycetota bacterium]|nr:MAG: carboxypeptidase regulatory-like domain-containing protein [Planctomycetota bacterium]